MTASQHTRTAFSLVELSIVLVILGLLVGGILAGQSLIRASELRSVNTDITKYTTATFAFKDKYFALPGDMANATAFWGIAGGTTGDADDTTCQSTASTDAKTCNGNGDGQLQTYEPYRYWQQLSNAGLIGGIFSGVGSGGYRCYNSGSNCPAMRIPAAKVAAIYTGQDTTDGYRLASPYANYFLIGNTRLSSGSSNDGPLGAILTTQEMWNIDTKMDDGLPNAGTLRTYFKKGSTAPWAQDVNNCSSANLADSPYDLSREGFSCAMRYQLTK